jgi:hypothetical protein
VIWSRVSYQGKFEGTKERPINICRECIEKLREKGLGPVQLLGREEVRDLILSIIRREF